MLAGFLGAGVLVVTVTVAVFLWTMCQRRRAWFKLNGGRFDPPDDPPLRFIHMLKGISIYPESLNHAHKVGRAGPSPWRRGDGHAHLVPPKLERALPVRADYCCSENADAIKTATPTFLPDTPTSSGSLDLSVEYDPARTALAVTVVGARGLAAVDEHTGTSDPYVKMSVLPERKHRVRTRVVRRSLDPAFNETFTFYGVAAESLTQLTLHFLVLSFDRYARHRVIGETLLPLASVELGGAGRVDISRDITRRNVQV